ncbi:MAG: histidine kinase [Variovorax sp.]|nr:histidine kinase [Variovorax sp.]
MRMPWRWLLLAIFLAAASAQATPLHVSGNAHWPMVLDDRVELLEDPSARLSVEQVQALAAAPPGTKPAFAPASASRLQPGFTQSAFWVRLVVVNDSGAFQPLRLALGSPRLHFVDFFVKNGSTADAAWTHRRAGAARPLSEHGVKSRDPLLMLDLQPGEQTTVLIRIAGEGSIQIRPSLSRTEVRAASELRNTLIDGLLIGGLFMLAAYSLMLSVLSRSWESLGQAAAFATLALYETSYRGLGKLYLWPQSTDWSVRSPGVLGGACALVLMLYLNSLARQSGDKLPGTRIFAVLAAAQVLTVAGMLQGNYYVFAQISLYTVPLIAVYLVVAGFSLARRVELDRWLFLAVVLLALASIGMRTIEVVGATPLIIPGANPYASGFSPAVVALAALMAWINHLSRRRQTAQKELIQWQTRHQRELEQEVDRQTGALTEAMAQLTETNRKQMRIMTYVAHDLRSPLATIVGHARALQDNLDAAQKKLALTVERNATYQLTLIDELLEFAHPELRILEVQPTPVHLPGLLDDIELLAAELAGRHGNRFLLRREQRLPQWVLLDGKRVRRVLTNLLENAAKFTRDGTIILSVRSRDDGPHHVLFFEVADTGIGIALEDQDRIFESFEQANADRRGLGLGLFIAQRIVGRMGGALKLSSYPGRGSQFWFHLVVARAEPPPSRVVPAVAALLPVDEANRPPTDMLRELARLAQGGQWSDIENWTTRTSASHPPYRQFAERVRTALEDLDFDEIQRLASGHDGPPG